MHWFVPQQRPAHAVAVMAPATGVPQRYYYAFARWLAARGYAVLCFDYRGMGKRNRANAHASGRTGMREWVRHDLSGALACAKARSTQSDQPLPWGAMACRWCRGWSTSMRLLPWVPSSGTGNCGHADGTAR